MTSIAMSTVPLASTRYAVRRGALTFGERVLELFATMGLDAFDLPASSALRGSVVSDVVEIVDRRTGQVVARRRDSMEAITVFYDAIVLDLNRFDATGFETLWTSEQSAHHS